MEEDKKLYAKRDIIGLDRAGNYYSQHVQAMTAEGLHSKSDIAAELAFRDAEIGDLKSKVDAAIELIADYGWIDGAHHKQWVLDQLMRILSMDYEKWVADFCDGEDGPDTYEWDEGIAP